MSKSRTTLPIINSELILLKVIIVFSNNQLSYARAVQRPPSTFNSTSHSVVSVCEDVLTLQVQMMASRDALVGDQTPQASGSARELCSPKNKTPMLSDLTKKSLEPMTQSLKSATRSLATLGERLKKQLLNRTVYFWCQCIWKLKCEKQTVAV